MKAVRVALCAGAALTFGAGGIAVCADQREPAPLRASELPGTYELVDRVLVSGKVLRRPDIAALYTFGNGRANFNLFVHNADGTLASESSIIRYTLSEDVRSALIRAESVVADRSVITAGQIRVFGGSANRRVVLPADTIEKRGRSHGSARSPGRVGE